MIATVVSFLFKSSTMSIFFLKNGSISSTCFFFFDLSLIRVFLIMVFWSNRGGGAFFSGSKYFSSYSCFESSASSDHRYFSSDCPLSSPIAAEPLSSSCAMLYNSPSTQCHAEIRHYFSLLHEDLRVIRLSVQPTCLVDSKGLLHVLINRPIRKRSCLFEDQPRPFLSIASRMA